MNDSKKPLDLPPLPTFEEGPQTQPEGPQNKNHTPGAIVSILTIAGIVGVQYAIRNAMRPKPQQPDYSQITREYNHRPWNASSAAMYGGFQRNYSQRLDMATFEPPAEGVVLEKYEPQNSDPQGIVRKSPIIIVPNIEQLMAEDIEVAQKAQEETFDIIAGLITKYGDINLVAENWPKGLTATEISKNILSSPEIPEELRKAMKDPITRMATLREMAKNGFPVNIALMIAFGEKITAVGTTKMEEMETELEKAKTLIQVAENATNADQISCPKAPTLTTGKAIEKIEKKKKPDKDALECACDFRKQLIAIMEERLTETTETMPKREANTAIDANEAKPVKLTVISSAPLRTPIQIETFKGKNIPYIVVSPKSIEKMTTRALKDKAGYMAELRANEEIIKTPAGVKNCEKWEKAK